MKRRTVFTGSSRRNRKKTERRQPCPLIDPSRILQLFLPLCPRRPLTAGSPIFSPSSFVQNHQGDRRYAVLRIVIESVQRFERARFFLLSLSFLDSSSPIPKLFSHFSRLSRPPMSIVRDIYAIQRKSRSSIARNIPTNLDAAKSRTCRVIALPTTTTTTSLGRSQATVRTSQDLPL